ncbi:rab-like protein 6 [Choristoneura fumiferana]|uniref:rab-like protein 6 n=1 Tax=Choristoneura fumiferana TaxID=7141 RepID=UPI003D1596B3
MFSALKKLARSNDERCTAPVPMSSSLQKKFSRGVHFNMKILIKGDRNVGKSCLLQRLQGGPFIEEYVPTDQIQVAPIHWTYKDTDHIVKVEVWEVVDKGRTKKKSPLGLKLENQSAAVTQDEAYETPVLDATFLDVYKNATGVILMLDITKPWTFEYVVKELSRVPADLPVVILGNHCDMQHHRQVHPHHIEQALEHAKLTRTAAVRYAESSMRNGFGLRLLHKFLSVPFLRLQRTSLLEQLQRNQKDMEEAEKEMDDFQNSEESHYNLFLDRLANKRRQSAAPEPRPSNERSPSIVLGAGKPIVPSNVNPLLAQSLNPMGIKAQHGVQSQFVSPELLKRPAVSMDVTPSRPNHPESDQSTPSTGTKSATGALDEFYAGALDSSFLDDLTPMSNNQEVAYESDSDNETTNPKVTVEQDDVELDYNAMVQDIVSEQTAIKQEEARLEETFARQVSVHNDSTSKSELAGSDHSLQVSMENEFPLWAGDARRSPEGGEDPDVAKETNAKPEKKPKKKKSKSKDKGDCSEKSEKKEKKHKHKKSKSEKKTTNPQSALLEPTPIDNFYSEDDYDSI